MRNVAGLVLLAALLGCDDDAAKDSGGIGADDSGEGPDDSGEPDDTDTPVGARPCEETPTDECTANPDCAVIDGRPMEEEGGVLCVDYGDPAQAVGCREAEIGCGDAETLAASPDDPETCWWFPSTCVPAGWTACADVGKKYAECAE